MRKIDYRPGKLALGVLISFALLALCGWRWWSDDWSLGLPLMMLFAASGGMAVRTLLLGKPALEWDGDRLIINTHFRSSTLDWREVRDIAVKQVTIRYMGLIPIKRQTYLVVAADGGMFGQRLRLSASSLDMPTGGIVELCASLQAQRLATVGTTGVAMNGAGPQGWGAARPFSATAVDGSEPFDPDAALARYFAKQDQEGAAGHQPPAIAPARGAPARSSFGRRIA